VAGGVHLFYLLSARGSMAATRIKLTVDDDWLASMQRAAKRRSVNVSEFIRQCVLQNLPKKDQVKLKEIKRGHPKSS
jgi:post-segregation antitoxin (ccd killing protein)